MEHSQLVRNYKVFKEEVTEPFELVRVLSNGDLIGKCYEGCEGALTQEEILEYIRINHVEETIE